jgi:hypothetical protein
MICRVVDSSSSSKEVSLFDVVSLVAPHDSCFPEKDTRRQVCGIDAFTSGCASQDFGPAVGPAVGPRDVELKLFRQAAFIYTGLASVFLDHGF